MYQENAVTFGPSNGLIGIVTTPASATVPFPHCGVVLLNAGVVHRVGQNRIYVKIARQLAQRGLTCMRFDYSGIGDSPVAETAGPLEQRRMIETCAALDYLEEHFNIQRFTLMGSCSGAVHSVRAAQQDKRVSRVALINPACTNTLRFFLRYHCMNVWTWKKIFGARIHTKRVLASLSHRHRVNKKVAHINAQKEYPSDVTLGVLTTRDFDALITANVRMLILCAQWDPSLDYYYKILKMIHSDDNKALIQTKVIPGCDHALYPLHSQKLIVETIDRWMANQNDGTNVNKTSDIHRTPYRPLSFLRNI